MITCSIGVAAGEVRGAAAAIEGAAHISRPRTAAPPTRARSRNERRVNEEPCGMRLSVMFIPPSSGGALRPERGWSRTPLVLVKVGGCPLREHDGGVNFQRPRPLHASLDRLVR